MIKEKDSYIVSVASPLELGNINKDKNIGYAIVTYNVAADKVSEKSKKNIIENIENIRNAGIQTELSGDVSFSEMEIGGITEVICCFRYIGNYFYFLISGWVANYYGIYWTSYRNFFNYDWNKLFGYYLSFNNVSSNVGTGSRH